MIMQVVQILKEVFLALVILVLLETALLVMTLMNVPLIMVVVEMLPLIIVQIQLEVFHVSVLVATKDLLPIVLISTSAWLEVTTARTNLLPLAPISPVLSPVPAMLDGPVMVSFVLTTTNVWIRTCV